VSEDVRKHLGEVLGEITALIEEQSQTEEQYDLAELRDEVRKHAEEIVKLIDELIEELRKAIPEDR
jgi:L-lactate utilization protein LutB